MNLLRAIKIISNRHICKDRDLKIKKYFKGNRMLYAGETLFVSKLERIRDRKEL